MPLYLMGILRQGKGCEGPRATDQRKGSKPPRLQTDDQTEAPVEVPELVSSMVSSVFKFIKDDQVSQNPLIKFNIK